MKPSLFFKLRNMSYSLKHAEASFITVEIMKSLDKLTVVISDN